MTVDTSEELLSRYLDGDLSAEERRSVERRLAADPAARTRLDALRRLVRELDALPREGSPPSLAAAVHRRVRSESGARRWLERAQGELQRLVLDSPLLASFAVVLALALSYYLLAHGVARWAERPTSLVVAPGDAASEAARPAFRAVEGRRFERRDGRWWEEGVEELPVRTLGDRDLASWLERHPADRRLSTLGGPVVVAGDRGPIVLDFPAEEPGP